MAARDIQLADAVVSLLDAQEFSLEFDISREYVTDWDVTDELASLQCAVIPIQRQTEPGDRRKLFEIDRLLLCFGQRLTEKTRAEIDGLVALTEEVIDFLERRPIETPDEQHAWSNRGWEDLLRFDPEELEREVVGGQTVYTGSFLSVTRLDYMLLT
jgi:hypothetical protein